MLERLAALSLRQRAVVLAAVSAASAAGAAATAVWKAPHPSLVAVVVCVGAATLVAAADYAFRARRRIASLPSDRASLARDSMRAYERSRAWSPAVGGVAVIWAATDARTTASSLVDIGVLAYCAVGFGLLSFGFWRRG